MRFFSFVNNTIYNRHPVVYSLKTRQYCPSCICWVMTGGYLYYGIIKYTSNHGFTNCMCIHINKISIL